MGLRFNTELLLKQYLEFKKAKKRQGDFLRFFAVMTVEKLTKAII